MFRSILLAATLFVVPSWGYADESWTGQEVVVPKWHVALRIHSPQTITEVLVEAGAKVKKGDVLIRFDDRQARINLKIAQLMLEKIEVQGQTSIVKVEREIAKAQVAAEELKLESFAIRAPFDGTIASCNAAPGEFVAKPEQPLMEIIGGPYHVELAVPERMVLTLKPGLPVEINLDKDMGNKTYKGKVALVAPVLNPQNRSVNAQISLQPEAETNMQPGQIVTVHIPEKEPAKEPKKEPKE